MAKDEHLAKLKEGVDAWNNWREECPDDIPDLRGAGLSGLNLKGVNFSGADLIEADLRESNLLQANLSGAELSKVSLGMSILTGADFSQAGLDNAALHDANINEANFFEADLIRANLSASELEGAHFGKANLHEARFIGSNLQRADLTNANLSSADLKDANLSGANIEKANFLRAIYDGTKFEGTINAGKAKALETMIWKGELSDGGFESVKRTFCELWLNWEIIRLAGRLPLFAASYLALILIPLFFYGLAFYNSKVDLMLTWADTVAKSDPNYDFAKLILETLRQQPTPSQSLFFVVSTAVLAFAATIYTFACPSRIKEFTEDVWVHQLGHRLVHYWP